MTASKKRICSYKKGIAPLGAIPFFKELTTIEGSSKKKMKELFPLQEYPITLVTKQQLQPANTVELHSSNTDGSFTMAVSNSCLSP